MLHISSRHNTLFKHLRRLLQGGAQQAQAVLEGVHLCQDWLRHRGQPLQAVFDRQRLESDRASDAELQALAGRLHAEHVVTMDSALLKALSVVAHAQGVLFVVEHPTPALPSRINHACVWLDRIQDPGNVGTMLRTAAAAGIQHAYMSPHCAAAWSPRVLRSAQGAHFVMTIYEHVDLADARRRTHIPLLATALDARSVSLYEAALPPECAWLFGNEGQGIAPELLAVADQSIHIPQAPGVESLNMAVAAGVCLFEHRRRHGAGRS